MAQQTLCSKTPSQNVKIAEKGSKRIYATYRATTKETDANGKPINGTCPRECSLLKICYANSGLVNIQQQNSKSRNDNVENWINSLPDNTIIRHLVSGDLFMNDEIDTEYINETLNGHAENPTIRGYGYTHGWERLHPFVLNALENLTFNASCDTEADISNATARGWDAVTVVSEDTPKVTYKDNYKLVVCPNQTSDLTCEKCMLCAKSNRRDNRGLPVVIGFRVHGTQKRKVSAAISDNFRGDAQ